MGLMIKIKEILSSHIFQISADDIFFLQDLKADSKNKIDQWLQKWDGASHSACRDSSSSAVMLFKKDLDFQVKNISEDQEGRYMWGSNLIKSFQFLLKTPMY